MGAPHALALGLGLAWAAAGCAPSAAPPARGVLFPIGPLANGKGPPRSACPAQLERIAEERGRTGAGSPGEPGSLPRPITVELVPNGQIEVLAAEVWAGNDVLFAGIAGEDPLHEVRFWAGEGEWLTTHLTTRAPVRGGLFDSVAYCSVRSASFKAPADGARVEITLHSGSTPFDPYLRVDPAGLAVRPYDWDWEDGEAPPAPVEAPMPDPQPGD